MSSFWSIRSQLISEGVAVKCLIVGDGSQHNLLKQFIETEGLSQYIRLLGYLEDPLPFVEASDLYVVPSDLESFGLAPLEAMSLSKPVITTDCGGPSELVEDGVSGFIVPVGDVAALTTAIRTVVSSPQLMSEMGKHSYLRYRRNSRPREWQKKR